MRASRQARMHPPADLPIVLPPPPRMDRRKLPETARCLDPGSPGDTSELWEIDGDMYTVPGRSGPLE